jgi:hypothetical protein
MTKTISMTFLLKNPAKVRQFIRQGIELLVKFEGEIVMKIVLPIKENKGKIPPIFASNNPNYIFNRQEIYEREY